ncbi:hypothetical protein BDB00DRAFT_367406 [Zychaea mexicana]|uniref:uncharacterized protein n=1 Tax=Zychaea mexicana TaxID=64656 RepID=UPI0022FE54AF|nr:uncharacterized protein BDB00DRAFT_367406 [Zychaea mexicana]KAI9493574.1 hypothetical protein BDB00DRAFT_367406 [Zychaea mexicana]
MLIIPHIHPCFVGVVIIVIIHLSGRVCTTVPESQFNATFTLQRGKKEVYRYYMPSEKIGRAMLDWHIQQRNTPETKVHFRIPAIMRLFMLAASCYHGSIIIAYTAVYRNQF